MVIAKKKFLKSESVMIKFINAVGEILVSNSASWGLEVVTFAHSSAAMGTTSLTLECAT